MTKNHIKTFLLHKKQTDTARWCSPDNLKPEWDERTQLIADLIPADSAVIEFGAARLVLRQHLDVSCSWQPCDLVKRSNDTIVFDLNGSFPELPRLYDLAVFSGVLEYVHDLDRLIQGLPRVANTVIFSYAVTDELSDPITRRKHGWVNSLSDKDIHSLCDRAGFEVREMHIWRHQVVYHCQFATAYPAGGSARG